jgi:hypothetical protein
MPDAWRFPLRALVMLSVVASITACEGTDQPPPRRDTTLPHATNSVEALPPSQPRREWDSGAGRVLLIRDDTVTRAIYPSVTVLDSTAVLDEALVRDVTADAMSLDGPAGSLRVRGFAAIEEECAVWPAVQLAAEADRDWTVALERGVSSPLHLTPIDSLPRADSARLAAQLTRLAARLPNDTARVFQGVPFVVRTAYVFAATAGADAAVAEILRRVNVEANPREETILLVAERDSASDGGWRVGYAERTSGPEATIVRTIPLGAVLLRATSAPALIVERGGSDWVSYALVQRRVNGEWRERWRSAHSGC